MIDFQKWNLELNKYISNDELDNVKRILATVANEQIPDYIDTSVETPLEIACKLNRINIVRVLLDFGVNPNFGTQEIPLHWAVSNSSKQIIEYLIKAGADIEAQNDAGFTALLVAARTSTLEITELLVEAGADVSFELEGEGNALMFAAEYNHLDIYEYLYPLTTSEYAREWAEKEIYECTNFPLISAIRSDRSLNHSDLEYIDALIQRNIDLDVKNSQGKTALMKAVEIGSVSIVNKLLRAGASKVLQDNDGKTVLDLAVLNNDKVISKLLQ
jgi:ankyrin repeat protein